MVQVSTALEYVPMGAELLAAVCDAVEPYFVDSETYPVGTSYGDRHMRIRLERVTIGGLTQDFTDPMDNGESVTDDVLRSVVPPDATDGSIRIRTLQDTREVSVLIGWSDTRHALASRLAVDAPSGPLARELAERVKEIIDGLAFPDVRHESHQWGDASEIELMSVRAAPRVFIGHGGDRQWEAVRSAVRHAGYDVEAFEEEERAGYSTLTTVLRMVRASDVALIVMTAAESVGTSTVRRARPNVVHELGLSQGLLGEENTVVILEEGTEVPSNIDGHIQIRYRPGEIHTVADRIVNALTQRAPLSGRI